jgi:hypothetical protein
VNICNDAIQYYTQGSQGASWMVGPGQKKPEVSTEAVVFPAPGVIDLGR